MKIEDLLGDWHVLFSNFPMWLKGNKTAPRFSYRNHDKPGHMLDVVSYLQRGKRREICGVDRQLENGDFIWRGAGLLRLFRSRWQVEYLAPDRQWALIGFEKSLITPAGNDIICRNATPCPSTIVQMFNIFREHHPGQCLSSLPADEDARQV